MIEVPEKGQTGVTLNQLSKPLVITIKRPNSSQTVAAVNLDLEGPWCFQPRRVQGYCLQEMLRVRKQTIPVLLLEDRQSLQGRQAGTPTGFATSRVQEEFLQEAGFIHKHTGRHYMCHLQSYDSHQQRQSRRFTNLMFDRLMCGENDPLRRGIRPNFSSSDAPCSHWGSR